MDAKISLSKNEVVCFLQKAPADFTREDLVRYIMENDIQMVNFMYPAADGRLKTLNFVINNLEYLETILTLGERVDGSSLFPFISAGSSDLYVIPRYRTKFRPSPCCAASATRTASPSNHLPSTLCIKPARPSPVLPE